MSKGLGFMTAGLFNEILFLAIISNIVVFSSFTLLNLYEAINQMLSWGGIVNPE